MRRAKRAVRCNPESGVALIWALALSLIVATMVMSGTELDHATESELRTEFARNGQAESVARAGLVDALAWMRRQTGQPVTLFAPRRDLISDPVVDETDDPRVGLVREFEFTPGYWARYEVRRGRPMDPFTDVNGNGTYDLGEPFSDLSSPPDGSERLPAAILAADGSRHDGYADGKWTPSLWTRDVSAERGWTGNGSVWRLESKGFIYRRMRSDQALGEGRNSLVAMATLVSEIRRLVMSPPAAAAICAPSRGQVTLGQRVRIVSDSLGIAVGSDSGNVTMDATAQIEAPSNVARIPDYGDSVTDVFVSDWSELKAMADVATRRLAGIPEIIRDYSLIVLERDVVYDEAMPLKGTGVLAIRGNLDIKAGSASFFSGLLYVDGNVTIVGPAFFRGVLVCTGTVNAQGSAGDYVEFQHDSATVDQVLDRMSQYRMVRAVYAPNRDLVDTAATAVGSAVELDGSAPIGGGGTGGTGGSTTWGSWTGWGDDDEDYEWSNDSNSG